MSDSTDAPAAEGDHLVGNIYWLNRYPSWAWVANALLCVTVTPVGVGILLYMVLTSFETGEVRTVYADD